MSRRAPILMALAISLGVHLAVLGFDLLPVARPDAQDAPLRPLTARLRALVLDAAPAAKATVTPAPRGGFSLAPVATASTTTHSGAPTAASTPATASAPQGVASAPVAASSPPTASAPLASAEGDDTAPPATLAHLRHFPTSARLRYWVNNIGVATLDWQRSGGRYTLETNANIAWFSIRYRSEGTLGHDGLKPDSFTSSRNGKVAGLARFARDDKRLDLGENGSFPLHPGTQDLLSVIYQVALLGAEGDANTLQITNGRNVYPATLHAVGETDYVAEGKKIHVVILRAQEQDGDTRIEFWLAPDYANQPVRIHFSGNVDVDLRARLIEINGKTEWDLPDPHNRTQK